MSTWVVGDIHGCYKDFMKLLKRPEIKKSDTVILIGDIIDRGPDSYKMIEWAMKNITTSGRYQMVLGNHEDEVAIAYHDALIRCKEEGLSPEEVKISVMNCFYGFDDYMHEAGFYSLASVDHVVEWFRALPEFKKVQVLTPKGKDQKYVIAHSWYGEHLSRSEILWQRDVDELSLKILEDVDYKNDDDEILIHGHTPTFMIDGHDGSVLIRDYSINIDTGCVFKEEGGHLSAIRLEDQKVISS